MGQKFSQLSNKHIEFIEQQNIYFVATAAEEGSVNLSTKGGDSLRVIDENTIVWLNLTGSGNESASHVLLNSRMTLMFCAFEGAPLILRTYGDATVLHQKDKEWASYIDLFPHSNGSRQIFVQKIHTVQTSCGKSVPYFDYVSDRQELTSWAEKQGKEGIEKYWIKKNQTSIDGFDTEIIERTGISVD